MQQNIELKKIESCDKSVLANLFQLYMHDITANLPMDVNEHGLFEYNYLDFYFTEPDRFAYFIYVEGKLAGFVLVSDQCMVQEHVDCNKFELAEMCILNAYKNKGIGNEVATKVFDLHKGWWECKPVPRSEGAKKFWLKTIAKYTNGNFKEVYPKPNRLAIIFRNDK